jgi:hypothetical protein
MKGTDDEAGATSANDCIKLYEGYYYTGVGTQIDRTSVLPCLVNSFCPGYPNVVKNIVRGAPSLPTSCPTGTKIAAGIAFADNAAFFAANTAARTATSTPAVPAANSAANTGGRNTNDCNQLVAGYFYAGPGSITSSTVKQCTADFFCNTEGLAIVTGVDTAAGTTLADPGLNHCPGGVNSLIGSKTINDCNILEPGYYYTGPVTTAISAASVLDCTVKYYW